MSDTCKHCKKEYNRGEVKRVLGEESSPYLLGYCSAQCYTKSLIKEDFMFEPADPTSGYGFIGTIHINSGYEDSWCQVFPECFYMGNRMNPVNQKLLDYIEKVRTTHKVGRMG